jgi:predicted short-subunit dehydrogenase-like oxidoreductase (DUF2520 family)
MKEKRYTAGIIGAGNLAFSLAPALAGACCILDQVISRDESGAKQLSDPFNASYSTRISDLNPELDIVFLTVPDNAIKEVADKLKWFGGILVHTSGSIDLTAILSGEKPRGVFYPLQTFSRTRPVEFSKVPVFIEGSDSYVIRVLGDISLALAGRIFEMDSARRSCLHLAAVFANNFTNFILSSSYDITTRSGIEKEVLETLIRETFEKALSAGPVSSQTGPARRGDMTTIKKHLNLLSFSPELMEIYKCLSDSILKYYKD